MQSIDSENRIQNVPKNEFHGYGFQNTKFQNGFSNSIVKFNNISMVLHVSTFISNKLHQLYNWYFKLFMLDEWIRPYSL